MAEHVTEFVARDIHPPGLDYGGGGSISELKGTEISERGMRFTSPWQFAIGTQLSVCVRHLHPMRGMCHLQIEGTAVWCEPIEGKGYETTLLFLELPDEIKPALREFSRAAAVVR